MLRVRGGGDANHDSKHNQIPALQNRNFQWNGLPRIDFLIYVMNPIYAGLGSISIRNDTLLAACRDRNVCLAIHREHWLLQLTLKTAMHVSEKAFIAS